MVYLSGKDHSKITLIKVEQFCSDSKSQCSVKNIDKLDLLVQIRRNVPGFAVIDIETVRIFRKQREHKHISARFG